MGVVHVSVSGRVTLDALVHDASGSGLVAGRNVASLTAGKGCDGGKVALLEGIAPVEGATLSLYPCTYRDSGGGFVSFETLLFAVVIAVDGDLVFTRYRLDENSDVVTADSYLGAGDAMIATLFSLSQDSGTQRPLTVRGAFGPTSYKIMVHGA
jgi:hypothetical protein